MSNSLVIYNKMEWRHTRYMHLFLVFSLQTSPFIWEQLVVGTTFYRSAKNQQRCATKTGISRCTVLMDLNEITKKVLQWDP